MYIDCLEILEFTLVGALLSSSLKRSIRKMVIEFAWHGHGTKCVHGTESTRLQPSYVHRYLL